MRGIDIALDDFKKIIYNNPTFKYLVKADIKALFPSIPQDLCLEYTKAFLETKLNEGNIIPWELSAKDILYLIENVITKPIIEIGNKTYHQIKGLPIGSPIAMPLAEIFILMKEKQGILNGLNRNYFTRYVDDCVFCIKDNDKSEVSQWIKIFKPLELIIEEEGKSITFLNAKITLTDNEPIFKWYRKQESLHSYLNYNSNTTNNIKKKCCT
jgi:hypothetical protein